jgi:hypothetical protein
MDSRGLPSEKAGEGEMSEETFQRSDWTVQELERWYRDLDFLADWIFFKDRHELVSPVLRASLDALPPDWWGSAPASEADVGRAREVATEFRQIVGLMQLTETLPSRYREIRVKSLGEELERVEGRLKGWEEVAKLASRVFYSLPVPYDRLFGALLGEPDEERVREGSHTLLRALMVDFGPEATFASILEAFGRMAGHQPGWICAPGHGKS